MATTIFGGAVHGLNIITGFLQKFNEEQVRGKHAAAALRVAVSEVTIASEKRILKQLKIMAATPGELAAQRTRIKNLKEILVDEREELVHQQAILDVHEAVGDSAKHFLGVLGPALLYTYRTIRDQSVAINEAVQQANTNYENRRAILVDNLSVVRETGVSIRASAEASKAMVDYGLEESGHRRNNLELMAKLNVALGVQYDTTAKLAAVYERQLGRSINNVADTIARIAAETAIAAQKAAEYAFQVARALRILGPGGLRTESERVTEVVAQLAGRVQEMGGDADSVMQLFQRMTSGGAEGMFLRGRAGVNLGALRTGEGATEALVGVVESMRQYINAHRELQPDLYAAQLHGVSEAFGFTADQAYDLMEAVDALNKPLNTQQTLEKAFREQQRLTAKSVDQLTNALHALLAQAAIPLYRVLRPVIDTLTEVVRWLANSPVSLHVALGAVSLAGLAAIKVLYGVAARLLDVARNGAIGQILNPGGGGAALLGGGKIGAFLARLLPQILRLGGPALIAGAIGVGVGTWLRRLVPAIDEIVQVLFRWFGLYKRQSETPLRTLGAGETNAIGWLERAAEAGARGQIDAMTEALKKAAMFEGTTAENMSANLETRMARAWARYQLDERYSRFAMPDTASVEAEKAMFRAMVAAQEYTRMPDYFERMAKGGDLQRQLTQREADRQERERQGVAAQVMHHMLEDNMPKSAPSYNTPGYYLMR